MSEPESTDRTVSGVDDDTPTSDHEVTTETAKPEGPVESQLRDLEGPKLLTNYAPKAGDYCLVNGEVAKVEVFEPAVDIFTALCYVGGGVNRITNHISQARFEPLENAGVNTDALDAAIDGHSWVANAQQETVDEGLTRTLARQGDQFTSAYQQGVIANQPHAGDSPELVRAKREGDAEKVAELTPTDASTAGRADTAPEDAALPGTVSSDSSADDGSAE